MSDNPYIINSKQIHQLPNTPVISPDDMIPVDVNLGNSIKTYHVKVSTLISGRNAVNYDVLFPAYLVSDTVFGYIKPKVRCRCVGLQMSLHEAADAPIVVDITTAQGVTQNRLSTLPTGELFADIDLDNPLVMNQDTVWRMKILSCGSDSPGAYLSVKLISETF